MSCEKTGCRKPAALYGAPARVDGPASADGGRCTARSSASSVATHGVAREDGMWVAKDLPRPTSPVRAVAREIAGRWAQTTFRVLTLPGGSGTRLSGLTHPVCAKTGRLNVNGARCSRTTRCARDWGAKSLFWVMDVAR